MLDGVGGNRAHGKAQKRLRRTLSGSDWDRLRKDGRLKSALAKMGLLAADRAAGAIASLYSRLGRRATDPAALLRSFALMLHLGHTSVQRWHDALEADALLRYLVGVAEGEVPSVGCHYDFINRLTGDDPHMDELWPAGKNSREGKAAYRELKQGEKWENYDEGDTLELRRRYWDGASCDADRWTLPLETLFDLVAVRPSLALYSPRPGTFVLSGDGSCLPIHASPFGNRVLEDGEAPDGRTHRYTAPDADIGWDSHETVYFFGFAFYNISWHSEELGIDLPVFIAQRVASQHDALTLMSAFSHMADVNPALLPDYFCHDSAADAAHIFQLLRHRGTVPIIDWNPRHADRDNPYAGYKVNGGPKDADGNPLERLNERGVPVCAIGDEMCRDGYDRSKMTTKYRCPVARGRRKSCPYWGVCTRSPYGRVVKTYDKTNYKLFGPVPHGSDEWKAIYRNRTCTERVNNRILNDYMVQHLTCRNGRKHFFFEIMAGINVHLDAWIKTR